MIFFLLQKLRQAAQLFDIIVRGKAVLNFILAPAAGIISWMIFLIDSFKEKFYLFFIVTHEVRANKKRCGLIPGGS